MDTSIVFEQFGIALALGLLVGLQRETAQAHLAGIRTFPLLTLLGAACALLARTFGGSVFAAALLVVTALMVIGKVHEMRLGDHGPGLTSEVAMLLMFTIGALVVLDQRAIAIAVTGMCAILLHFKVEMHGFVARLGDRDVRAIMQFVLAALVILPLLPDRTYGPYDVLNPHRIWSFVVLIIGLSVFGYILTKFLGERAGILLAGTLGGLVSSTATTVSQARRTRIDPTCAMAAVTVVMLASAVMYARILLLIGIAAPPFFAAAWAPITILMLVNLLLAAGAWAGTSRRSRPTAEIGTPSELRAALVFGLLYAVVLFVVAAVRDQYGASALYALAGISGLTDVDAITLSMSQLVQQSRLEPEAGWRLVILATLSNLLFKAAAAGLGGDPHFRRRLWVFFAGILVAGASLMLFWPRGGAVPPTP